MRGKLDPQAVLFSAAVDLDQRIRADHPLRAIKGMVDQDLRRMSRRFDAAYAEEGRPSVPPERLIKAYGSIKSFKPKDQQDARDDDDRGNNNRFKSRNAEVDFHGQKRSNDTHQSTTDPDAKLICKSDGQPAQLCHALHAIVENRHGLVLGVEVNSPLDNSEPTTALALIDRIRKRFRIKPRTVGTDKGYDQGPFLRDLEKRKIRPHVAVKDGRVGGSTAWYRRQNEQSIQARSRMRRRTRTAGYTVSQRCRKKIEELFGWAKTIAGLARTRLIGHWKTAQQAHLAGAAFNLIRMRNLSTA